ncbi:hypothetical protein, partial [Shewanella salipaludis]|uniref:hypothetical protein n=1 Tax=Shewanella salipaludis TaxID=2723052 RepID=UPI001B7D0BB3
LEDSFCQIDADEFIVHNGHLESDFLHLNHGTLRCRDRGDHLIIQTFLRFLACHDHCPSPVD